MNILNLISKLQQHFPGISWQLPVRPEMGLLTTNYAFTQATIQAKNPVEIAKALQVKIKDFIDQQNLKLIAVAQGPYLNLKLRADFWDFDWAPDSNLLQTNFCLNPSPQSFVIDMFHPNVGKRVHVGHIRSGNLGESMRRILSLKYSRVVSDNFLGDWGIQFSYISWGILNLESLGLGFARLNLQKEPVEDLITKFYQIYVRVNQLLETREDIKKQAKNNSFLLEEGLQNKLTSTVDKQKYRQLLDLYTQIVSISITQFRATENYLFLNQNPGWLTNFTKDLNLQVERVKSRFGCHLANLNHQQGSFDLTLGETFYLSFLPEFDFLAEQGLLMREGKAIYLDLLEENLGRCYLVSSEGYSLYQARDVACRIVWAGVFGFDRAVTFTDLRQKHSFKQLFQVLQKIIGSKIYQTRNFGWLTRSETDRAMRILSTQMAEFQGFGHFNLPGGEAMSTRKGKIIELESLQQDLKSQIVDTLKQKNFAEPDPIKVQKLSIAALKWVDLYRDREQDVVFDPSQFLQFEGNTGIYQLYTVVRLNSILSKNLPKEATYQQGLELNHQELNQLELDILNQTYQLPLILEEVCKKFKPHLVCNHIYSLTTKINKWYVQHPVGTSHSARKSSLLVFCLYLKNHLQKALNLLGIEVVDSI